MRRVALFVLGLALAACGEPPPPSAASLETDGATLSAPAEPDASAPEGLTPAAAETFRRLKAAAEARDAASLIAVAAENPDFAFTFGPERDFAEYIASAEMNGEDPTGALAQILALPHGESTLEGVRVFHWPSFDDGTPSQDAVQARADAARIVGGEAVAQMSEEQAFIGPRAGVDETGRWLFYLTGD